MSTTTTHPPIAIGSRVYSRRRPKRLGVVTEFASDTYNAWLRERVECERWNADTRRLYAEGFIANLQSALRVIPPEPSKEPTHARVRWTTGRAFHGGMMTCSAWVKISELRIV